MSDLVQYEVRDRIAHVTITNGKANALSPDVIAELDAALHRARQGLLHARTRCVQRSRVDVPHEHRHPRRGRHFGDARAHQTGAEHSYA